MDVSTYPNVFRRWEWISTWWKWFGKGRDLYLIRVTRGAELVGLAPLYTTRARFAGRRLAWIGAGGPTYPEYLGPIIHREYREAVVREMSACLRSTASDWQAMRFPDAPPDDTGTRALADALARKFPTIRRPGVVCPYLSLPGNYEMLLRGLTSHGRQRKRRQLRKARKDFRVKLTLLDTVAAVRSAFPTVLALSTSARGMHGQRSPFANAEYAGFHREVIELLLPEQVAKLYLLCFDDKPVAFQYGYQLLGKYYDFQNGFDLLLGEYSPGAVLLQLILEHLIAQGVTEFDFLRGEEAYKNSFATGQRCTENISVFRRVNRAYVAHWLRSNIVAPVKRRLRHGSPDSALLASTYVLRMKSIIRNSLLFAAVVLTLPLWLPARVAGWITVSDDLFATCSQIVSVFPGVLGIYLRRGFYRMTLERSAADVSLEWGTWFSHPNVHIGRTVYIGTHCTIGMCDIADDVLIGSNVDILSGRHQHRSAAPNVLRNAQGGDFAKLHIGRNVWIGNSAVVMADVGEGSVIGAGSVVVKPIPPGCVAVGNPAAVKKTIG